MLKSKHLLHTLAFLSILPWASSISPPLTRRATTAAAKGNPFLAITPSHDLEWHPCYQKTPSGKAGVVECARLLAPLDYSNSSAGNAQLAIVRVKGSGSGDAVFYNPGGPGDDPLDDLLTNADLLRTYVGKEPDLIAVVPRGVSSTFPAMTCDESDLAALQRSLALDSTLPGYDQYALAESYALGQSIGLDCVSITPDSIPYIGTVFVAHDLDLVREKLGHDLLSYLGFSYGTALGGTYAALFPDRVGRMVLDGVLDLNDYWAANKNPNFDIGDADLALNNFFEACFAAGKKACAIWSNSIDGIKASFNQADQAIHDRPLPVPSLGLLTWPLWREGVYSAMYRPSQGFPLLAGAIAEILDGSAGPYIKAYLEIVQSASTSANKWPVDPTSGLKNSPNNGDYISCSDSGGLSSDLSTGQLKSRYSKYEAVSSYFGGISFQYAVLCLAANLPSAARYPTVFKDIDTKNPILYVGNTADPTTPIRNAYRMSAVFSGSHVLAINGTGHISFNAASDTSCATKWIAPYFKDGTLPPNGTVCDGNQKPFASSG